ncbi:uncharacterized protein K02A2.6 [Leptinotarsa decemlineata]|uniref:uncharacterized protein K02A2.6 n=1 Tax=Leptinotarsa decemlineata TaxID=7539 RepID=UPI003D308141
MNGIKHLFSPPYHAQSNGCAEICVKKVKNAIKKAKTEGKDIQESLEKFLFDYRVADHSSTKVSPSKMMFGRNIKTRLDLIRPSQKLINDLKVQSQIDNFGGKQRNFELGEKVVVKDFSNKEPTWIPGEISRKSGNVTFDIALEKGKIVRRHSNQIRSRMSASPYTDPTAEATAELATENQCSDLIEKSSCVSEDISIDPETAIIGSDAPLAAGNRYNLRSKNKS